jgi:RimJ/RimL family protein N-acetyltransferase
MRLRDVELGDVGTYVRLRCDPIMMTELGGPLPRKGIEEKVARDVQAAAAGTDWIKMIVPDEAAAEVVAGSVALWSHDDDGSEPISEIGWMVLPEFQGRGLAKRAVRMLLEPPTRCRCRSWSRSWCWSSGRSRPRSAGVRGPGGS